MVAKKSKTSRKIKTKKSAKSVKKDKKRTSKKSAKEVQKTSKRKKLTKKEKEQVRKEIFKKAEQFKKKALEKYKDLVKTIFVFGSYLREDFTRTSDLDVLVLLDDTKMRITDELKDDITSKLHRIAKDIDDRLHMQPAWTVTEFWDMVRMSHPLLHTVLRDGWAIYDQGFFIPMKKLLERGKIPSSLEAVELLMASAPQKLERAKRVKLYQISEDCYSAMLNSSQAVLMYLGKQVPDPKHTPKAVKEYLVDTKMLPKRYLDLLQEVLKFRKDVEHKKRKTISGEKVDEYIKKAEQYVKKMEKIYQNLQNQKKKALIDRNYEVLLKSTIYTLKKMNKLPPDPKNLPIAIRKELINKNYLPKSYLETFDKVVGMKKAAEENISKIPERDVELTRSYVKKFVDILDKITKDHESKYNSKKDEGKSKEK